MARQDLPLYKKIYDDLLEAIERGDFKPGDMIYSEPELTKKYEVSRITVRKAVLELCEDGYLTKRQGVGTFVNAPRMERTLSQVRTTQSFTELCEGAHTKAGAKVVRQQIVPARTNELEFFGLDEGALLIHIQRIRTSDGRAICDENNFVPYDWCPALLQENLEDASFFATLARLMRKPVSTTSLTVSATKATKEQATQLHINKGDALLCSKANFVDAAGTPVCMGRQYFVGSRYEMNI